MPFYALLYREATWNRTGTEESAMQSLCTVLCCNTIHAVPDFTKLFQTKSDASNTFVGSILSQEHASFHKPIAFFSRTLTISEKKYKDKVYELLVIIIYCKVRHLYIDGQ